MLELPWSRLAASAAVVKPLCVLSRCPAEPSAVLSSPSAGGEKKKGQKRNQSLNNNSEIITDSLGVQSN